MENFEELVRLKHKMTEINTVNTNTQDSSIEEIKLKLSQQQDLKKSNEKNKIFFDALNKFDCFECKNNIIKFKNKFYFNEEELKNVFDIITDMYKSYRQEKFDEVKTLFSNLKKLIKENNKDDEKEFQL